MSRALATLARLRRLQADEARRALGDAVARENEAEAAVARARADQAREAALARAASGEDCVGPLAAGYAAWLPVCAAMIAAGQQEVTTSRDQRVSAAASLVARRAALEAVETLIDIGDTIRRRQAGRRAQHTLDEQARRPATLAAFGPQGDAAPDQPAR